MVPNYKRKIYRTEIKEIKVKHAIRDIMSNKYNISDAARVHGLTRYTLNSRLKRFLAEKNITITDQDPDTSWKEEALPYSSKCTSNQIFTKIQEKVLAGHVKTCCHLQQGYTYNMIQKFVFEYGVVNKIKMPTTWINNKETGLYWLHGFMKRNAEYLGDLPEPLGNTHENGINLLRKRARESITLEERVQIIKEYEHNPHMPSIAELFDCNLFQVIFIIHSKEETMIQYAKQAAIGDDEFQQKIVFLEEVLYEYILRATYHDEKLDEFYVKQKTRQIKNCIGATSWYPTEFWMQQFMKKYKITGWELNTLKELLIPDEEKDNSLVTQNIINYVRCVNIRNKVLKQKNDKTYNTHIATDNLTDDAKLQDLEDTTSSTELKTPTRDEDAKVKDLEGAASSTKLKTSNREDEINFLGRCMFEFIKRKQYIFNCNFNMKIWLAKARSFNKILKIDSFDPNNEWLLRFKKTYQISKNQKKLELIGKPAIGSLVPKHIINYCRQNKDKAKIEIRNKPDREKSETFMIEHAPLDVVDVKEEETECLSEVELIDVEEEEMESLSEVDYIIHKKNNETSATFVTCDDEDINSDTREKEMEWFLDNAGEELQSDEPLNPKPSNHEHIDIKPDTTELHQALENDNNVQEQPIKIQCIERLSEDISSEHQSDTDDDLNVEITSNARALKLLKPLEDFALLDENYRAIGLITQLQNIFKNRQKS